MKVRLGIDFWKLSMWSVERIKQALRRLSELPDDQDSRNRAIGEDLVVRLLDVSSIDDNIWEGGMMKLRMNEQVEIGDLDGHVKALTLRPGEALSKRTAFVLDATRGLLAIQRTRSGANQANLIAFMDHQKSGDPERDLDADPVLTAEATARLRKVRSVVKFELSLSGRVSPESLVDADEPVYCAAKLAHSVGTPRFSITGSLGRGGDPLTALTTGIRSLMKFAKPDLRRQFEVKKVRLSGQFDDSERQFVDLIADRLRGDRLVDSDDPPKGLSIPRRLKLLRLALNDA